MEMKPIETLYKGILFRSRLEARWAVFFDALGIHYRYEPEAFEEVNGVRYLPDFFLPQVYPMIREDESPGLYVEVKGVFDERARAKAAMFDAPLFLVGNIPESFAEWRNTRNPPLFTGEYLNPSRRGAWSFPFCFDTTCAVGDAKLWAMWNYDEERTFIDPTYEGSIIQRRTDDALAAARAARFETWHKQRPAACRIRGIAAGVPFDFKPLKTAMGNLIAIKALTACSSQEAVEAYIAAGGRF